jgi:ATP-dependent DNA helicase RecG
VEVARLGLAVVDEQHRFGVQQRSALRQKGFNPHLLVMTATPIPRTLGLTIYGDLDISTIDEMPPGRQPIKTKWFPPDERKRAYEFMRRQVQEGRQAFVICPLIEESEKMEVRAATAEYERLHRLVFPEFNLGLLHGRLKNKEKDEAMQAFARNEVQILVSTSVVEVGIDVPNATVMAIEGAERFGLAQLHQFRGRVGRGEHQSYCMLLSDSPAAEINPRLHAIEETQNGFRLAEIDLELRGPGELFGTRQSGLLELKVAKLTDVELIEETRREAGQLLDRDPELVGAPLLRERLSTFWKDTEVS